jgi:hypothetical protein
MRYIREYKVFEASAPALTAEQISWLDECADGSWKLNSSTGFVDVNGDFYCGDQGLTDLKGVKFGKVSGYFYCNDNQLTSLVGAPQSVGGNFWCGGNQLTSLEGAPQSVVGNFWCDGNQLTSLVGAPQSVGGGFYCENNQLTSLVGAPQTVNGDFWCDGNQLTSLEGVPKSVDGDFNCADNPVSESTLDAIFALMKSGMGYQQALEEHWPEMGDEDRGLMYKQMTNLPPEDVRKYKALAMYNNIKGYL